MEALATACRNLARNAGILARGEALLGVVLLVGFYVTLKVSDGGLGVFVLPFLLGCWCLRLVSLGRRLERTLDDDGTPALRALVFELAAQALVSGVLVILLLAGQGGPGLLMALVLDGGLYVYRSLTFPSLGATLRFLNIAILSRMVGFIILAVACLFGGPTTWVGTAFLLVYLGKEWACTRRLNRFMSSTEPDELAKALGHLSTLMVLQAVMLYAGAIIGLLGVGVLWLLLKMSWR